MANNNNLNNDAINSVKEIFDAYIVSSVNKNTDEKIGSTPDDIQDIKKVLDNSFSSISGDLNLVKSKVESCTSEIRKCANKEEAKNILTFAQEAYKRTKNNIDDLKTSSTAEFEKIGTAIAANGEKTENTARNIESLMQSSDENAKAAQKAKTEITEAVEKYSGDIKSSISADISKKAESLKSSFENKVNTIDTSVKEQANKIIKAETESNKALRSDICKTIDKQQSEIIDSLSTAFQNKQTDVIDSLTKSIDSKHTEVISKISENKDLTDVIDGSCSKIFTYIQKREEANQLIIKKQQKMMYFIISINVLMFLGVLISMVCLLF